MPPGAQALERAASSPRPDLILLDVVMPGMDGFEVCRRLKRAVDAADTPIIQKIRRDDGTWEQIERYIAEHSLAEFTHGICEKCEREYIDED